MSTQDLQQTLVLNIDGMHCGSCAHRVEQVILAQDGVRAATVELANKRAVIALDESTPADELIAVLREAGYKAQRDDLAE